MLILTVCQSALGRLVVLVLFIFLLFELLKGHIDCFLLVFELILTLSLLELVLLARLVEAFLVIETSDQCSQDFQRGIDVIADVGV